MNDPTQIVDALLAGEIQRDEALKLLASSSIEDLDYARLDHARARRRGFPEVVFGPGKTPAQLLEIVRALGARNRAVLATRVEASVGTELAPQLEDFTYDERARLLYREDPERSRPPGNVLVVSAGTSDEPVAREAWLCARIMGNESELVTDVGVAGLHRLLGELDRLRSASVLIAVAGMENALASVAAGLVECPVISVPTSVGYGANFEGLSALLASLTSCAAGVVTVNIDNGFGAAYAASLINRRA